MQRSGSKRHQLDRPPPEQPAVAQAVLVTEASLQDIGDAFYIGVRMHRPDSPWYQAVMIENSHGPTPICFGSRLAAGA